MSAGGGGGGVVSCQHCTAHAAHPQFAALVCDRRRWDGAGAGGSTQYVLEFSRAPLARLAQHNCELLMERGPKATRAGAPHNHHAVLISGFVRSAGLFVELIRTTCRTFDNTLLRCVAIASVWHDLDPAQTDQPLKLVIYDAALALIGDQLRSPTPTIAKQIAAIKKQAKAAFE